MLLLPAFLLALPLPLPFLWRLVFPFVPPVFDAIAVLVVLVAAGFFPPAFLFCAANTDVPARANTITALIRILFIIVLRRIFLAAN